MSLTVAEDRNLLLDIEARQHAALRTPSDRAARLLARLQERMTQPQLAWGDAQPLPEAPETSPRSLVERHALAFEAVLQDMPIAIEEDDLIVGNCVAEGLIVRTQMPRFASAAERERARAEGAGIGAGLSHKTPFYYDLMDRGLGAILDDVETRIADAVERGPTPDRDETLAFLRAVRHEGRAVIAMAGRFADLAEAQAVAATTPERRDELLGIAAACRRVPEHAPRSFHEAVQSFWFVHFALFSTGTKLSCGRLDQYLYPSLRRDLDAGAITLAAAQELVDCLWLRFNDRAQICRESFYVAEEDAGGNATPPACDRPLPKGMRRGGIVVDHAPTSGLAGHRRRFSYATDAADAINHFGQNILLSGVRPDGGDGTNVLTWLCLNALEKFPLTSPVVSVRLHHGSPPELRRRCAEVLKQGGGMPYLNNDDVLVPAYVDLGVPLEDARDYANSNCWETMIEGKSDQELLRGMNFLLFVELALQRGVSSVLGPLGPDTGDPTGFADFDALMAAWQTQLDHQLREGIDYIGSGVASGTLEHSSHGRYRYNPFLSALTHDCLATERDVIRGGARYTIWHVMGEAVANAIDAMSAVKTLVYDEGAVDMQTLLAALAANWEGHQDLRRRVQARVPRFANNDEAADAIGRRMMDFFVERTRFHAARHPHVIFPASVGTFSWYAKIGKEVGATADGRCAGEPIAANLSPALGADLSGPTAAIGSYLKMRVADLAAGAPIDLRFSSSGLRGEDGTTRLAGLIDAFVALGGNMLTITVTDVEDLRRAMAEPDSYRHLRVRMGGWSAYFVMLGQEQQRLHIRRVEHGLG